MAKIAFAFVRSVVVVFSFTFILPAVVVVAFVVAFAFVLKEQND